MNEFLEAEQMAMFVYAQSKTSAVSVKASMFGVCMKLLPYALFSCGLRSSATCLDHWINSREFVRIGC